MWEIRIFGSVNFAQSGLPEHYNVGLIFAHKRRHRERDGEKKSLTEKEIKRKRDREKD